MLSIENALIITENDVIAYNLLKNAMKMMDVLNNCCVNINDAFIINWNAIENDLNAIKLLSHMNAHRNKFNALPNVAV